jgi:hypothetical protein
MECFAGWENEDGLLEHVPPCWNFLDWSNTRKGGVSVGLQAYYVRGLEEAARLERLAGEARSAAVFESRARKARESLERLCGAGPFYPDILFRDAQKRLVPSPEKCETTQNLALWAGIPSEDRAKEMWRRLRDDYMPGKAAPSGGLARAGLYTFPQRVQFAARLGDHAAVVRDLKAMYLPMVESAPGTLWEHPVPSNSLCHGVGTSSAAIMVQELLGIRLGWPLRIAPHAGGALRACKGHVTYPQGRVAVQWELSGDRYELRVSLPQGVAAEVVLPPEARSAWSQAASAAPWPESIPVAGNKVIEIRPGQASVQ